MRVRVIPPPIGLPKKFWVSANLVIKKGKMYFRREGRCNPKKCGNACCKIRSSDKNYINYLAAMDGIPRKEIRKKAWPVHGDEYYFHKTCPMLKDGKCSIYPRRPGACYHFPSMNDGVYFIVKQKCSFKFVRITKKEFERSKSTKFRYAK